MQIKYTLKVAEKVAAVDAKVAEVDANVAAVGEMVAEIGVARQKGGRSHPEKKVEAVRTAWTVYLGRTTARMGVNTRPTNRGAFDYSRRQLELAGVTTLKEFSEIKHALRVREYRQRLKIIDASSARTCASSARTCAPETPTKMLKKGSKFDFVPNISGLSLARNRF